MQRVMMAPPNLNAVECPGCGQYKPVMKGHFARHSNIELLRECVWSRKGVPADAIYAAQLVDVARLALKLTEQLRDEDPAVTWRQLTQMDRQQLQTLSVVALAAIGRDQSLEQSFGWVMDLPAARQIR